MDFDAARMELTAQARMLGFDRIGVTNLVLPEDEQHLLRWLEEEAHGDKDYMRDRAITGNRPGDLAKNSVRVVSARMNYWPENVHDAEHVLRDGDLGYVSRFAVGPNPYDVMQGALEQLAEGFRQHVAPHGYRVWLDAAPVLQKALSRNAGLGWIGKHTILIGREAGTLFLLGELLTDLPLPVDTPATSHCGTCEACITGCPTRAIIAPNQLDARRCIAYLTIEHKGSIPLELRKPMGNRIYGCDDCQLVCPWNKFARSASHPDFKVRHRLDAPHLTDLFAWSQEEFDERMQGSAISRIGYERWLRNIAVALGNAPTSDAVIAALQARQNDPSEVVRMHVEWALEQHLSMLTSPP